MENVRRVLSLAGLHPSMLSGKIKGSSRCCEGHPSLRVQHVAMLLHGAEIAWHCSGVHLQVAAALALGATGAVMGTRFAATKESMYSEEKKQRYLAAKAADTHRTRLYDDLGAVPWPTIVDARTIGNTFSRTHGTVAPAEV